jgi:hypothetical protein
MYGLLMSINFTYDNKVTLYITSSHETASHRGKCRYIKGKFGKA